MGLVVKPLPDALQLPIGGVVYALVAHVTLPPHQVDGGGEVANLLFQQRSVVPGIGVVRIVAIVAMPQNFPDDLDDFGTLLGEKRKTLDLGRSELVEGLGHIRPPFQIE